MIIKVCGIIDGDNLRDICQADIDMVGLNFYPPSKRYLKKSLPLSSFPIHINKVGVFVNENIETVKGIIAKYELDYVQLHGNESIEYCHEIQPMAKVIKAFSISTIHDFDQTKEYSTVEYLLFDTKTKE